MNIADSIYLVDTSRLKHHEQTSVKRLQLLIKEIIQDGIIKYPIIIDSRNWIILDGHHRCHVLKKLNLRLIPGLFVDYDEDDIKVIPWKNGDRVSKEMVKKAGLTGKLLKPKTTRHILKIKLPRVNIPLTVLSI